MTSFYAPNHLQHIAKLEERFGAVSDEVAVALRSLVRVICQYEDPIEAIPFLERCLSIEEALHGPQVTLSDLNNWIGHAAEVDVLRRAANWEASAALIAELTAEELEHPFAEIVAFHRNRIEARDSGRYTIAQALAKKLEPSRREADPELIKAIVRHLKVIRKSGP